MSHGPHNPRDAKFSMGAPLSRDDGSGNRGLLIGLARDFFDMRSFPQIMKDWQEAAACQNDAGAFLRHIGLDDVITDDEFSKIFNGERPAGIRLLQYLRRRLDEEPMERQVASPSMLYRLGCSALNNDPASALELERPASIAKREEMVTRLARSFSPIEPAENVRPDTAPASAEEDGQMLAYVLERIREIAGTMGRDPQRVNEEEVSDYLKRQWKEGRISETASMLAPGGTLEPRLLEWAEAQFNISNTTVRRASNWPAGALLHFFREYNGLERSDMEKTLGVTKGVYSNWERGRFNVDTAKLGNICKALHLNENETVLFAGYVNHALEPASIRAWYAAGQWEFMNFPALDPQWLDTQPKEMHAGLLMETFCHRRGLSLDALAEKIGVTYSIIQYWKNARGAIAPTKLGDLCNQLQLGEDEAVRFAGYVNPALDAADVRTWQQAQRWDFLNFPALDDSWLDRQPQHMQAGLLLRAFRERSGYDRKQFAHKAETTSASVNMWENGSNNITAPAKDLRDVLKLSDEEIKKLDGRIEKSRPAIAAEKRGKRARWALGAIRPASDFPEMKERGQGRET